MVFGPFIDVAQRVKALKPSFLSKKPHFNFITIHYFWIIGLTIVGSILLYPARTGPPGGLNYIDALFFASGACTQSGLNTVDVNLLNVYQQIVLFFLPMLTNPITINTFVVFLRLYWFEKRFQHIAREAKKMRRTIAKSFSKSRSQAIDDGAVQREEMGVNGRDIVVIHTSTRANGADTQDVDGQGIHAEKPEGYPEERGVSTTSAESSGTSSSNSVTEPEVTPLALAGPTHTIKFADEVKRSDGFDDIRMPQPRTAEEHLAVLRRQREDSKGALRIPGPREQDQGMSPEQIDEDEVTRGLRRRASTFTDNNDGELHPVTTHPTTTSNGGDQGSPPRVRRGITIHEPEKPGPKDSEIVDGAAAAKHIFAPLRPRKPRMFDNGADDDNHLHRAKSRTSTFAKLRQTFTQEKEEVMPYLSWEPTVGRNSAFIDLDEHQREELGGIEYRSLKSLALVLVLYFWGFMIFGWVSLVPWIRNNDFFGAIPLLNAQNRTWWGFFTGTSAFTDLGFTLTPDSMISFQGAIWPLLLMSFLIIIGNTGFPIMLRFIIWVTTKWVPKGSGIWEELKFLLDHPRRCFTLLFPASATWWLFWILVILNGLDLIFFIILDLGNPVVTDLPVNIRILGGWFQAVSTRTAGFAVVNLAQLHPAIQVSYMLMMYISVLPIAISVRRTNVYEEKSLGIWGSAEGEKEDEAEPSYVGAHLRRQLSFDLWYIFLGFFIISISEGTRIQSNSPEDYPFTMFAVLFEVVSAYGTVGLSLGYPTINASFSAEFGVIAKLVIIAMQIRGRHRGLPYELDRAILLPSESLHAKENVDQANTERLRRRNSSLTPNVGNNDLAQIGSGASKATGATRGTTRSRRMSLSRDRGGNILSSLLHPGPMNVHRYREQSRGRPAGHIDGDEEARGRLQRTFTGGMMQETNEKARGDDERDFSPRAVRRTTML